MKNDTPPTGHRPQRNSDKEKFWRDALRRFGTAGQNIRQFCKANGLTEPSFYSWRSTIAQRDGIAAAPRTPRPSFVELRPQQALPRPDSTDAALEIVAGNRRLLIRAGCDRELLRDVLAMLEA